MLREKDPDSAELTQTEAARLLDMCRDGEIGEADAHRLVLAIRSDDETSTWILGELELAGLISQALDSTNGDSFVRGLVERLAAESAGDDFAEVTEQKIASVGPPQPPQAGAPRRPSLLSAFFGRKAAAAVAVAAPRPRRWRKPSAPLVLAAAAVVAVAALGYGWIAARSAAVLLNATPGRVTVARGEAAVPGADDLGLRRGDIVKVAPNGSVVVAYRDETWVILDSHTDLWFEPESVPAYGRTVDLSKSVYLDRGSIMVEVPDGMSGVVISVFSPHVKADVTAGSLSVSVTPTSTRVELKAGAARLLSIRDDRIQDMRPGDSVVVSMGPYLGVAR